MKKYLFYVFSFICLFLSFSGIVSAKSVSDEEFIVSFGENEVLNLAYTDINSFKISEDKSFYFNGVKHNFNEDYSLVDGSISVSNNTFEMEDDVFKVDLEKKVVTSSKTYQTYMFDVEIKLLKEKSYTFTQELCYKYGNKELCSIDIGDITEIDRDSSYAYYYDFVPFYDSNIVFDYIEYKFKFEEGNNVINKEIIFYSDEINYQDSFKLDVYNGVYGDYYFSSYKGKEYVNLSGSYVYLTVDSFNKMDTVRNYDFYFYICLGDNECIKINEQAFNVTTKSTREDKISLNLYNYLYKNNQLMYSSFKLKMSYVYKSGDDSYLRRQTTLTTTNEQLYYVSVSTPYFNGKIEGSYYYGYYISNSEITNNITFEDDNGVLEVYYLISKERITSIDSINVEIDNGSDIKFGEDLEGIYYLYFKLFDGTGIYSSNINSPYIYLFDKTGPSLKDSNFDDYQSEGIYNDVSINVSYQDDNFSVKGIYYLVIKESEYENITREKIISNNKLFATQISVKDHINEDGVYRVCFVAFDYLDNYTNFNRLTDCSNSYYLDVTGLTKHEVSISDSSDTYSSNLVVNISVAQLEEGTKFKCGIFSKNSEVEIGDLSLNCSNKEDNEIRFNGEGEYNLWIYASDVVGNYSLLKFDEVYLVDNIAPRLSYTIEGNNKYYSNNVKLHVSFIDINQIDTNSLAYQFYLSNYNENDMTSFDIEEGISYPFDYYGTYKVAIKACDIIGNCTITSDSQTFLIDTGRIKLELIGEEEITILRWGKYNELGAKASKGNNSRVPVSVDYEIEGSVDSKNTGVYYITYKSGSGINEVMVTRKVIVKDSVPYFIGLSSLVLLGEAIILLRLFIKKRKNDSI